jgi:hypothetical protein
MLAKATRFQYALSPKGDPMKIFSVHDGNKLVKSFCREIDAQNYAGQTLSVVTHELYPSVAMQDSPIERVEALQGMGEGLSCILFGAGPSNTLKDLPDCDMRLSANARYDIPLLDFNLYQDKRYENWLRDGVIKLDPSVKHISQEGCANASYWFSPRALPGMNGHTGKVLLYMADKLFRFKNIYLIGYDYTLSDNGDLHANEPDGICNADDKREHTDRIFECMLSEYNTVKWTSNIVNLNPKSALKLFTFQ